MGKYFKKFDSDLEHPNMTKMIMESISEYGSFTGSLSRLEKLWGEFSEEEYYTSFAFADAESIVMFVAWLDEHDI